MNADTESIDEDATSANAAASADAETNAAPATIEAVRAIETKKTSTTTKLLVLGLSLAVFVGAGLAWWDLKLIVMLVVVLFFHEAGHYIAMQMFGYRNVKMFFIPLMGAAVSGRHFHIDAWKKAVVYFAGPVPGILVSLPLMAIGLVYQNEWLFELGGIGLVLNALNLFPILPLDGGWLMHLTVLRHSPGLELFVRAIGIAVFVGLGILAGEPLLIWFSIPLLLMLPATFRVSKLVRQLRDERFAASNNQDHSNWNCPSDVGDELASSDANGTPVSTQTEIPIEAINEIANAIQSTSLATAPRSHQAALIVQVYESLIVRPPSTLATILIWAVHVGILVVAIGGGFVLFALRDFSPRQHEEIKLHDNDHPTASRRLVF
ncbi:site-2 protease family protein [Neorhodopirellula lusitana]|uniref:site-2 protease family protein n=1 Tax=Neorhodopirellula lusitana TaxID=445327 RepID=UPI003850FDD2